MPTARDSCWKHGAPGRPAHPDVQTVSRRAVRAARRRVRPPTERRDKMTKTQNMIRPEVDWQAAELVADGLGLRSRKLVADRDELAVREWALRMHRENVVYGGSARRAASY